MHVKEISFTRLVLILGALTLQSQAAIRYVNGANTTPSAPYTSWATAASGIQPAVDAAVNGDTVLVADGTYWLSAEISVTKNITVESVNGADVTTINGQNNVRCLNLGGSACVIRGFTIQNGQASGIPSFGGGIYCSSAVPVVEQCTIRDNYADEGGGMFKGTANNCTFRDNDAYNGGGLNSGEANNCLFLFNHASHDGGAMYEGTAVNCTMADNDATHDGGGMFYGTAKNCVAWYNVAGASGFNFRSTAASDSCYSQALPGSGNIGTNPQFVNRYVDYRLASTSPCLNLGNNAVVAGSTDVEGNPRIRYGTVDMGAYEFLTSTYYVSPGGANKAPYASWATAAHSVPSAVALALDGHSVYVANGTYLLSSEIAVSADVLIESVNGPDVTIIDGGYNFRCFSLGSTASVVSGFTVRNGYTEFNGGGILCSSSTPVVTNCVITGNDGYLGGGMYGGTANDCIFSGNVAFNGGGMDGGTANDCVISGNTATVGGGTRGTVVNDCSVIGNTAYSWGGGMYGGTANHCIISNNTAEVRGGGMYSSTANNSLIINNTAYNDGGGCYEGSANQSTIRGNSADTKGGGTYETTLNSIVWYNSAPTGNDIWMDIPDFTIASVSYSCSPDVTHNQSGNTTDAPLFIDNVRPAFNSPCIDTGDNTGAVATDLDGNPRLVNGTVDMGAYEYDAAFYDSNSDGIPDAWGIQYFGSATGGLASANGDADPADNGSEYIAGTDPTNSASFFSITNTAAVAEGFVLEWEAVAGRVYSVNRRDSLTNSFQTLETAIAYPQGSYTDTNLTVAAQSFYQLGVMLAE